MVQNYRNQPEDYKKYPSYAELIEEKFGPLGERTLMLYSPKYGHFQVWSEAQNRITVSMDVEMENHYALRVEIQNGIPQFQWSGGEAPLSIDLREMLETARPANNKTEYSTGPTCSYKIENNPTIRTRRIEEILQLMEKSKNKGSDNITARGEIRISRITDEGDLGYKIVMYFRQGQRAHMYLDKKGNIRRIGHIGGELTSKDKKTYGEMLDSALETFSIPEIYLEPVPVENAAATAESTQTSGIVAKIRKKIGI